MIIDIFILSPYHEFWIITHGHGTINMSIYLKLSDW
jgi:hypothetical protein